MGILKKLFVLSSLISFHCAFANIKALDVERYKLKNGMTVLLHQDEKLPMYSLHLWYKVGSKDEDPKLTGLAHFFEHLMFKGTKKYPEGRYDEVIERFGGVNNAFTTRDYTGYFVEMPKGTLKKVLELEADRMKNLDLSQESIDTEREVVKEERRLSVENNPSGLAYEKIFSLSYKQSPYRWPIIGSMEHLNRASLEEFKKFYDKYYNPTNATLVLVGSFRKKQAKRWIAKYFSPLKTRFIKRRLRIKDRQKLFKEGSEKAHIKKELKAPLVFTSFPAFSVKKKESFALDVIASALSEGKESLLYKYFVEQRESLIGITAYNYSPEDEGLFMIYSRLRPGSSLKVYEKNLKKKLNQIIKKGLNQKQIDSAKKKIMLSLLPLYKTQSGKARALAYGQVVLGDYSQVFESFKVYESLSLKEINKVLKNIFNYQNMKTVEVYP